MSSLPVELERLIFEIVASQETDHNSRVRLLLVAKRVYEWYVIHHTHILINNYLSLRIRPILYRVVVIVNRPYGPRNTPGTLTISNRWPNVQPALNSAQFVRHFLTTTPNHSHLLQMLSTFPNIENLAVWSPACFIPAFVKKMNDLPLRMLSVDKAAITDNCPAFKYLTHLETFDLHASGSTWDDDFKGILVGLPKLTHLCFDHSLDVKDAVLLHLLKHCASLRVLILLTIAGGGGVHRTSKSDDPRCLILLDRMDTNSLMDEWERSANRFIGRWEVAELIIEARENDLFQDKFSFVFSRRNWKDRLNDDGIRWYEKRSRGLRWC